MDVWEPLVEEFKRIVSDSAPEGSFLCREIFTGYWQAVLLPEANYWVVVHVDFENNILRTATRRSVVNKNRDKFQETIASHICDLSDEAGFRGFMVKFREFLLTVVSLEENDGRVEAPSSGA